jgi:methyl-accepting chemotaxis protein
MVLIFVMLTSALYVVISRNIYMEMKTEELSPKAKTVSDFVLFYMHGEISFQYFSNLISAGPSAWDSWVFVLDKEGKMIVETTIPEKDDPEGSFVKAIKNSTEDVLSGKEVEFTGSLPEEHFQMMIIGIPIIDSNEVAGAVFLAKPLYEITAGINSLNRALLLSTAICLLLMAFPAVFAFKSLIKPLKETRNAALAMSEGDFSARARINSDDEIGDLASTFNLLAERLEKTVSDLITEKNRLIRILN